MFRLSVSQEGDLRVLLLCLLIGLAMPPARAAQASDVVGDATIEACLRKNVAYGGRRSCIGLVSRPCRAAEDGATTRGSRACTTAEAGIWDRLLNRHYKLALSRSSPEGRVHLRRAQLKWIVFRDEACEWPTHAFPGGADALTLSGECHLAQTALRAIDLLDIADHLESR